nr:hypothetical protein [Tanacetum cinerariifolium]
RNAHVEDIVESGTAIAQTFLYLRQWLHISSGSGNNLHWQWKLILPVRTLTWQWECLVHFIPNIGLVLEPHQQQ